MKTLLLGLFVCTFIAADLLTKGIGDESVYSRSYLNPATFTNSTTFMMYGRLNELRRPIRVFDDTMISTVLLRNMDDTRNKTALAAMLKEVIHGIRIEIQKDTSDPCVRINGLVLPSRSPLEARTYNGKDENTDIVWDAPATRIYIYDKLTTNTNISYYIQTLKSVTLNFERCPVTVAQKSTVTLRWAYQSPTMYRFLESNRHYYAAPNPTELVTWYTARDRCAGTSVFGMQGYLVTPLSNKEMEFIGMDSWTCAGRDPFSTWKWVCPSPSYGLELTYLPWEDTKPDNLGVAEQNMVTDRISRVDVLDNPTGGLRDEPSTAKQYIFPDGTTRKFPATMMSYVCEYGVASGVVNTKYSPTVLPTYGRITIDFKVFARSKTSTVEYGSTSTKSSTNSLSVGEVKKESTRSKTRDDTSKSRTRSTPKTYVFPKRTARTSTTIAAWVSLLASIVWIDPYDVVVQQMVAALELISCDPDDPTDRHTFILFSWWRLEPITFSRGEGTTYTDPNNYDNDGLSTGVVIASTILAASGCTLAFAVKGILKMWSPHYDWHSMVGRIIRIAQFGVCTHTVRILLVQENYLRILGVFSGLGWGVGVTLYSVYMTRVLQREGEYRAYPTSVTATRCMDQCLPSLYYEGAWGPREILDALTGWCMTSHAPFREHTSATAFHTYSRPNIAFFTHVVTVVVSIGPLGMAILTSDGLFDPLRNKGWDKDSTCNLQRGLSSGFIMVIAAVLFVARPLRLTPWNYLITFSLVLAMVGGYGSETMMWLNDLRAILCLFTTIFLCVCTHQELSHSYRNVFPDDEPGNYDMLKKLMALDDALSKQYLQRHAIVQVMQPQEPWVRCPSQPLSDDQQAKEMNDVVFINLESASSERRELCKVEEERDMNQPSSEYVPPTTAEIVMTSPQRKTPEHQKEKMENII